MTPLSVRRVVTGHDADLRAVVVADETLPIALARPGQEVCIGWANASVPADNLAPADEALTESRIPGGTAFRIVRYDAGRAGRMHRTQTLDYGIVMQGSIVLELDDGAEVTLHAGDVLVQRGTIHNWVNRSDAPCTIAFVLIDAEPIAFP